MLHTINIVIVCIVMSQSYRHGCMHGYVHGYMCMAMCMAMATGMAACACTWLRLRLQALVMSWTVVDGYARATRGYSEI